MKIMFEKIRFAFESVLLICSSWENIRYYLRHMHDSIKPIGQVTFTFRDELTGAVRVEGPHPNLIVRTGLYHIADQMSDQLQAAMSHMAVGTGTTAVVTTDTALETELDRNALDSVTQGASTDANKVTYSCTWAAGDGTGALTEAGIFNSASAGTMFCRSVFAVKNKEAGESMVLDWVTTYNAA